MQTDTKTCWPQKQKLDDKIMQSESKISLWNLPPILMNKSSSSPLHKGKKSFPRVETHTWIKCRCCSSTVTKSKKQRIEESRVCWCSVYGETEGFWHNDTVRGVHAGSGVYQCVCPAKCAAYSISWDPQWPSMGQPAPAPGLFKALPCIFNEWLS